MENVALQRGPIVVLSTERFSSKLGRRTYPAAAAIFRVVIANRSNKGCFCCRR
jgi:hypothetical protein